MQVSKWGNSLAVRLPAAVVDALKFREGDDIEFGLRVDSRLEIVNPFLATAPD